MKPIALSPGQLDAALAVAPVRHLSPLQVDHVRNVRTVTPCALCHTRDWGNPYPCTNCGADKPPKREPRRGP